MNRLSRSLSAAQNWTRSIYELQNRERQRLLSEVLQIRDLMPLLMKQRNGYRWTPEDRRQIKVMLGKVADLSPYIIPLVMPGGFLVLPALAWWLDRRKNKQRESESKLTGNTENEMVTAENAEKNRGLE